MRLLPPGSAQWLQPLRDEILARATSAARALHEEASRQADALLGEASRNAEAIGQRAVDTGTAAALSDAAQVSARQRRRAHELQLAGREALRRELEDRVVARAAALRSHPEYPRVLDVLRGRAIEALGPHASTEEHPDGGIVAYSGTRSLDMSLPNLARATLASMIGEVSQLWMS